MSKVYLAISIFGVYVMTMLLHANAGVDVTSVKANSSAIAFVSDETKLAAHTINSAVSETFAPNTAWESGATVHSAATASAVPEVGFYSLLGIGLAGLVYRSRSKSSAVQQ